MKWVVASLLLCSLMLGAASAYLWHRLESAGHRLQVTQARNTELELTLRALRNRSATGKQSEAAADDHSLPDATALAASSPSTDAQAESAEAQRPNPLVRPSPASRAPRDLRLAEKRSGLRRRMPDLAAAMGLTDEQADLPSRVEAMVGAREAHVAELLAAPVDPSASRQLERYHIGLREAAAPYLSPPQLTQLGRMLDQELEVVQMRERMFRARREQAALK